MPCIVTALIPDSSGRYRYVSRCLYGSGVATVDTGHGPQLGNLQSKQLAGLWTFIIFTPRLWLIWSCLTSLFSTIRSISNIIHDAYIYTLHMCPSDLPFCFLDKNLNWMSCIYWIQWTSKRNTVSSVDALTFVWKGLSSSQKSYGGIFIHTTETKII